MLSAHDWRALQQQLERVKTIGDDVLRRTAYFRWADEWGHAGPQPGADYQAWRKGAEAKFARRLKKQPEASESEARQAAPSSSQQLPLPTRNLCSTRNLCVVHFGLSFHTRRLLELWIKHSRSLRSMPSTSNSCCSAYTPSPLLESTRKAGQLCDSICTWKARVPVSLYAVEFVTSLPFYVRLFC